MRFRSLVTLVTASFALLAAAYTPPPIFTNTTIFLPPSEWRSHATQYARVILLDQACETDNVLLTTFTINPPNDTYLPVYKSVDGGFTWAELSRIHGGFLMQPFLYELPIQVGNYPRGTILATANVIKFKGNFLSWGNFSSAGNFSSTGNFSLSGNFSSTTNIDIYASKDKGETWDFVSTAATGGAPNSTNGADPIWEPFISTYDGQVVVYYSDSRDPRHAQKLSHQTSGDLVTWDPVVNDIVKANYSLRPGMTVVAQMGNGKYILTYELGPEALPGSRYPVYYCIADSPLEFENATDFLLKSQDGAVPNSAPYVVWTPAGGSNGTVVVSDGKYSELFLNTEYGDPGAWSKVRTGLGSSYSRSLQIMPNNSVVLVVDGGLYRGANTSVTAGEFVIPGPQSVANTTSTCK